MNKTTIDYLSTYEELFAKLNRINNIDIPSYDSTILTIPNAVEAAMGRISSLYDFDKLLPGENASSIAALQSITSIFKTIGLNGNPSGYNSTGISALNSSLQTAFEWQKNENLFNSVTDIVKRIQKITTLTSLVDFDEIKLANISDATILVDHAHDTPEIIEKVGELVNSTNTMLDALEKSPHILFALLNKILLTIFTKSNVKKVSEAIVITIFANWMITYGARGLEMVGITDEDVNKATASAVLPMTIVIEDKELKSLASDNSKTLQIIKAGTEICIVRKYQKWLLVSYIDNGWHYGFTRVDSLE